MAHDAHPDVTSIKMELINEDEGINNFDKESYDTYQTNLTPDYLVHVSTLCQNKTIVDSKPCDSTSSTKEEPERLECSVVLEDFGDSLKNNPCFCSDCEILFPTENALDSHKMTAHSFLAAVERNIAIKSTTKSSIAASLKFKTDSNMKIWNFRNRYNQVCPDQKSLRKHSDELLTKKFSCEVCDSAFDSKISLEQHLRTHPSVLMSCCPICFCYFTNKIVSHMVKQHQIDVKNIPEPEKPTFKCRFCAKSLSNARRYNAHIHDSHPDVYKKKSRKFECQPCNLTCPSAYPEKIRRVSQHAIEFETSSKSVDLDKQIKIEPLSPKISHQVSQHTIKTYSKSVDLDKQIKIEPLSPKMTHRASQHTIKTYSKSVDLNKQIKIETLTPKITHRLSQHAIEFETSSKSLDLDKQIKIEPLSPKIIHRVSQHAIEAETSLKSVDLDKQIKIEPLSPKMTNRVSQHTIESETHSKSVDLDKLIKIEPLSSKMTQTVLKQGFIRRSLPKSTLFKCSKCQIHFVSSLMALEHTKRCALKKGNWKCKTCRILVRRVDRHAHTMQHDWTDRFKILTVHENMSNSILCRCVSCKVCSDERTLIKSHEGGCPKSISFLCNMCNENIHEKALTKHMKVHNEMDSESFVVVDFVNFDQSTLSSTNAIKPTIKNLESKKPVRELKPLKFYYYCPTCRYYMKVNKLSDKHNIGKCKRHLLKRLCKLCGLTFSVKCFETHMKYHKKFPHLKLKDLSFKSTQSGRKINPPPPDFSKCVNCEVKFYRTFAINNHVCNGDEAKTCGYCGDMFSDLAYKLHVPFHEYAGERKTVIKNERMNDNPDNKRAPTVIHRVSQLIEIEIESAIYSKSVDLDKQIKIEPLSP